MPSAVWNSSIPVDKPAEVRPGLRRREADFPGFQKRGERGFNANFPYPEKGDRGEDTLPPRQALTGPGPFKNLTNGRR